MSNGNNGHNDNGTGKALVQVNGTHHDPAVIDGHDLLWDGLAPAVTKALEQPLDPALVSQRKGRGRKVFDYLEGHVVIDQANKLFGYGGWGYGLAGDVTLRRIEALDTKTGEVKVSHAYSAPVRVTVPGAPPRTDTGFHAVAEDTAEGHETAIKGAATDGMKRALRSFGDRFGNGLYGDPPAGPGKARQPQEGKGRSTSSQTTKESGATPLPQRIPTEAKGVFSPVPGNDQDETHVLHLRKRLIELGVEQGFDEERVRAAVRNRTGRDLDDLMADELTPLVEGATQRLHQMQNGDVA